MNFRPLVALATRKKWWPFFLLALFLAAQQWPGFRQSPPPDALATADPPTSAWRSGHMVQFSGTVYKLLPTDNRGRRHQRWLMRVPGREKNVLVAHNIDLAQAVPLKPGDYLSVYGQYEANEKGGVVHWTHKDPRNRRTGGWVKHKGHQYH